MDLGVLLSLPLESIAVRVVLATLLAIVLVRALLRAGLRTPRARVATALAPVLAIGAVLVLSVGQLHLPALMLPVEASDALPVRVSDGYLHFAPAAVPLLLGLWALVAALRLLRRSRGLASTARAAEDFRRRARQDARLQARVSELASRLGVVEPEARLAEQCPGGASVLGHRRPVLVVDAALYERLDAEELDGVVAHELAHVRRRDNLVAALVGSVRDLTFFIPGGGWALHQLHRERELAADQIAARLTGRPGALASGLLKVLEDGEARPACATLAPRASVVDRVAVLVDEREPPGRTRSTAETATVVTIVLVAVALALALPAVLTGAERQRDALAVVWSAAAGAPAEADYVEARAFDVYRRSSLGTATQQDADDTALRERSTDLRRGTLRTCGADGACSPPPERVGLGLSPRPTITVDHELHSRWRTSTVVAGEGRSGFQLLWLQRVADGA